MNKFAHLPMPWQNLIVGLAALLLLALLWGASSLAHSYAPQAQAQAQAVQAQAQEEAQRQADERATVLAGLRSVDYVVVFEEETPADLIRALVPDVLVKGGDWRVDQIVGRDVVEAHGGTVVSIPLVEGRSTTNIIAKILSTAATSRA